VRHCIIVGADVHVQSILVKAAADRDEPVQRSYRNTASGRTGLANKLWHRARKAQAAAGARRTAVRRIVGRRTSWAFVRSPDGGKPRGRKGAHRGGGGRAGDGGPPWGSGVGGARPPGPRGPVPPTEPKGAPAWPADCASVS